MQLIDTVPSGGATPTSVTVRRDLVYVLNAGDPGNITGFTVHNGHRLVVSERANQRFDVYAVNRRGLPVGPTVVSSSGLTPYGFAFDQRNHVIASEAMGGMPDASAVSSYDLRRGGFSLVNASVPTTETSACWIAITPDGRYAYSGNAASQSVTGCAIGRKGDLTILTPDGKTGSGHASVTTCRSARTVAGCTRGWVMARSARGPSVATARWSRSGRSPVSRPAPPASPPPDHTEPELGPRRTSVRRGSGASGRCNDPGAHRTEHHVDDPHAARHGHPSHPAVGAAA